MIASTSEWSNVELPLRAASSLIVAVASNDDLTIGTPHVSFGPTTLATTIERRDTDLLLSLEDVPEGAVLLVPVRARTPISAATATLVVTIGQKEIPVPITLDGHALFLEPRSKWVLPQRITLDEPATITLQLRNDGTADAHNVRIEIPLVYGLHITGDGELVADTPDDLTLVVEHEHVAVGQRIDVPLTVTWVDPYGGTTATFTAYVSSDNSADAHFVADLQLDRNGRTALTATPRETSAHVRQPVTIDVTIANTNHQLPNAECHLQSDGLEPRSYTLGTILPRERRSFTIVTELSRTEHHEWTVPFKVVLSSDDAPVTSTADTIMGAGRARLRATIGVSALDATLAREISVQVTNNGTGTTHIPTTAAVLALPDGVRAVVDSLRVDGKRVLQIDGSVPERITLGAIAPGASRTFSLRARSAADVHEPIAVSLSYDDQLARIESDPIDFPNAHNRTDDDTAPAPAATLPTSQEDDTAQDRDEQAEEAHGSQAPADTHARTEGVDPNSKDATPVVKGTQAEEPLAAQAPAASDETQVASLVPASALPTYRESFTAQFEALVPVNADAIELGRLVLGLYDFLPLTLPNAETELANLRVATSETVERYLPSIQQGTFGASGYALVSEKAADALRVLRERLGEPPIEADAGDRVALLGILELVDAAGDIRDDIRKLAAFVTNQVRAIDDEESLGNVIPIGAIAA